VIVAILGLCSAAFASNVYAGIAVTSLAIIGGIVGYFYAKKKVTGLLSFGTTKPISHTRSHRKSKKSAGHTK
jgi:uncharacterized membrane protein (UPF0136 family)